MVTVKTADVCTLQEEWLEKLFNKESATRSADSASRIGTIQYEHPSERKVEAVKFTGFLKSETIDSAPNYYQYQSDSKSSIKKYSLAKRLPGSPEPFQFYLDPKLEDKVGASVHLHRQAHTSHCAKQSLPFWPELVSAIAKITRTYQDLEDDRLKDFRPPLGAGLGSGSILARALQATYGPAKIGATIEALSEFLNKQNDFVCLEVPEQIQKGDFILGYDRQDKPKQAAICFESDTVLHDANGKPERTDVHLFAGNPQFASVKVFRFAAG